MEGASGRGAAPADGEIAEAHAVRIPQGALTREIILRRRAFLGRMHLKALFRHGAEIILRPRVTEAGGRSYGFAYTIAYIEREFFLLTFLGDSQRITRKTGDCREESLSSNS